MVRKSDRFVRKRVPAFSGNEGQTALLAFPRKGEYANEKILLVGSLSFLPSR